MKIINGIRTPENFGDIFCRWVLHMSAIKCKICLDIKRNDKSLYSELDNPSRERQIAVDSRFIALDEKLLPMISSTGAAKRQRWTAYKRHIKTVHNGNWDIGQGMPKRGKQTR